MADTLGARFHAGLDWSGAQLDRLVDGGHAELQNAMATMLRDLGWLVAVEVSFNHYGDRGRYDILAFHPPTGVVLVVEVKTAVGDVQATLGTIDVKVRLALGVVRQQGWTGAVIAIRPLCWPMNASNTGSSMPTTRCSRASRSGVGWRGRG